MGRKRMRVLAAAVCLAALVAADASHAQTYPAGNVRIMVPYPAKYSYASMSLGQNLITTEKLFRLGLNLPIVRIPFPGATPILTSIIAGHTLMGYIGLPPSMPYIKEGTLRALAVTSPKRSPVAPDVPTL